MKKYFQDISQGFFSILYGMKLTAKHLVDARQLRRPDNVQNNNYFRQDTGIVTLQYPFEEIPIPDNGRYRLYNEIDDCIVCDKCAVVCPVNCIEIETIKSPEPIGETSDGSVKRLYAGKFNIDMAKCCFCGLCTTVCPTECLTMTKAYDFSEFDIRNMNYHFSNLSPEEADEKKRLYEQFVIEKEEAKRAKEQDKQAPDTTESKPETVGSEIKKPAFKPFMKPVVSKPIENSEETPEIIVSEIKKPAFKPVMKPVISPVEKESMDEKKTEELPLKEDTPITPKPKPIMKPVFKKPGTDSTTNA